MEQMGLLHLYYGDGKGKTTAAMGLALRALGSGKKVVIVQFLKGGKSGEIPLLEQLGAMVYRGKAGQKFVFQMNDAEKDMVDKVLLRRAVLQRPAGQECVLTAHAAPQWMLDAADYVTEMKCIRHPYQKGIAARKGVEY